MTKLVLMKGDFESRMLRVRRVHAKIFFFGIKLTITMSTYFTCKVAIKTVFHMLRSGVVSDPSLATSKIVSRNPFFYCETPEEPGGGRGSWGVRETTCKMSPEK